MAVKDQVVSITLRVREEEQTMAASLSEDERAATGQTAKALELLPDALRLDTELAETARHDSDLDALRGDPQFQSLLHD